MKWDKDYIDYKEIASTGTGNYSDQQYKSVVVNFERYAIKVKLTIDGKFVDIEEVSVKRSFVNQSRLKNDKIYVDLDKYYEDE
jgi:hypothetical protein